MANTTKSKQPTRSEWRQFFREISPNSQAEFIDLLGKMRQFSYSMRRRGEESMEKTGLSEAQFRILIHLLFSESIRQTPALNPSELSRREGTNRNTISSLIRSLEKEHFIVREVDANDRRKFNIRLTESGRDLVYKHAHNHYHQMSHLLAILDAAERDTLGRILQKLNDHIDSWES